MARRGEGFGPSRHPSRQPTMELTALPSRQKKKKRYLVVLSVTTYYLPSTLPTLPTLPSILYHVCCCTPARIFSVLLSPAFTRACVLSIQHNLGSWRWGAVKSSSRDIVCGRSVHLPPAQQSWIRLRWSFHRMVGQRTARTHHARVTERETPAATVMAGIVSCNSSLLTHHRAMFVCVVTWS